MAKKINPWAICHSQLGKKKTDKFERCVMKIKSKHGIKDWTEFKAALRYLSETIQGQEDDIRVARERQEKEAARKAALRKGDKSKMGESVSFKDKLAYLFEQPQAGAAALARKEKGYHPGGTTTRKHRSAVAYKKTQDELVKGMIKKGRESTEYEGPSLEEKIAHLVEKKKKDWIQGAVDPAHKGFCTPMTKKTCTPARKALAKRFKKAGRREGTKAGGKTGWKGKV